MLKCVNCGGKVAPLDKKLNSCVKCGMIQPPPRYLTKIYATSAIATLLKVAKSLSSPFTLTQLVIAAWQHTPSSFGLPEDEERYPSDNRVRVLLFGRRGLISRGLLRKVENGMYEVTEAGLKIGV